MFKAAAIHFLGAFFLCVPVPVCAVDPPKASAQDYSKEAFVIEQSTEKLKFENDGTYIHEIQARVRIQADAGIEHYSILKFAFQNSSDAFAVDYVRVVKPDGTSVVTPPDTYQDMPADITRVAPFYSDAHEMQVAVKGLGVGDVLEYKAHWQHNKPLIPGQFWLNYSREHQSIILEEKLEVSVPHERNIKLKSPQLKPVISRSGDYDVYTWNSSNLQDKTDEQRKQEQQQIAYQQVRGRLPLPEIQLSTFQSWDELGKWYDSLQHDRVQPTPEIQAKAADLTKGLPDEDAKIHALYDFVSTKYRYIGIAFGIGRYQPHTAADVLDNQYGDCKDKHTLFASLLAASGIKAYPALISGEHDIDPDVPSPGQFDHVITAIPQKSGILWLDTTTEVAPFGVLVPALRGKHALVIAENKPAELMTTIEDDPLPLHETFRMDAKLSDAGVLDGKGELTDRGDNELILRSAFRMVPLSRWKDLVQRLSYNLGFAGDVSDVEATSPEKLSEPFHFAYSYKRKDYSDWAHHRITPPVPPLTLPTVDDEVAPIAPIWLGSPGEINYHATVELPKGFTANLPKEVHEKRDFADYDATYSFAGGVITSDRRLTIKLREVPPAEYADYKSFRKAIDDDYNTYTSLIGGNAPSKSVSSLFMYQDEIWELPYSENPEAARLYDDARGQYENHDVAGEIDSLKKAVALDPKFIRAWLWLGDIYKSVQQTSLALESYHKAIDIDPQLPVSYKALGSTLGMLKRNDEAIAAWQQLIKVAPDRPDGYANLGFLLFGIGRYREAISPLESAVRLFPGEAGLEITLGKACVFAGEKEKALVAFQEASKLNPTSAQLNDMAYQLAEKNIGLDTAKEYAARAVANEENEASKLTISQVVYPNHADALATYWDTLGWVYFRMGDLNTAQKYLTASWEVSQSAVVGQHLGKLYEKEGKKIAALHMYQLAHSAAPLRVVLQPSTPGSSQGEPTVDDDLKRLGGKPDPGKAVTELTQMRTFDLPRILKIKASASFYILLGPGNKVEVKFQSGDDALKPAEKLLSSLNYKFAFPDHGSERLARNGTLSCFPYSGCSLELMMTSTFVPQFSKRY